MPTQKEIILTLDTSFSVAIIYDDVTNIISGLEITNNHSRRVVITINNNTERSFPARRGTTTISLTGTYIKEQFEGDPLKAFPITTISARLA